MRILKSVFYRLHLWFVLCFLCRAVNWLAVKAHAWQPDIMTLDETMACILERKVSVARFGDGEYKWMLNIEHDSFQECDARMQKELIRVLHSRNPGLLLCTADYFGDLRPYKKEVRSYWSEVMVEERNRLKKLFPAGYRFGNLNITRFYMDYTEDAHVSRMVAQWKTLWKDKNLLIAEGACTRLGVGNDLFDNVRSIRRILCPARNAYQRYDEIFHAVLENAGDDLILLALGPTATILAADLSEKGYWAIDIGHIDVEYEWYRKQAKTKIPLQAKYVNEAVDLGGRIVGKIEDDQESRKYAGEIIKVIS